MPKTKILTSTSKFFHPLWCFLDSIDWLNYFWQIECCIEYEYCISCCLRREQKPVLQEFLQNAADNNNVLFVSVSDHFELCLAKCRTSSSSVQHENTYRDSRSSFAMKMLFRTYKILLFYYIVFINLDC